MNSADLAAIVDFCEDRWPGTRNFRRWDRTIQDFVAIPAEAAWAAVRDHFNSGERTAPTLSQIRGSAATIARDRAMTTTTTDCSRRHDRVAITDHDEITREAMCLDCGTIIYRPIDQLPTVGEAKQRLADGADPLPDELADRIAP